MSHLTQTAGFEVSPMRTYGLIETDSPGLTMTWVDRGADILVGEGRIAPEFGEALKAEARQTCRERFFFRIPNLCSLDCRETKMMGPLR